MKFQKYIDVVVVAAIGQEDNHINNKLNGFALGFKNRDLHRIFKHKLENLYKCFSSKKKYILTINDIVQLLKDIKNVKTRNKYSAIRKLIFNTLRQNTTSKSEIKYFVKLLKIKKYLI